MIKITRAATSDWAKPLPPRSVGVAVEAGKSRFWPTKLLEVSDSHGVSCHLIDTLEFAAVAPGGPSGAPLPREEKAKGLRPIEKRRKREGLRPRQPRAT